YKSFDKTFLQMGGKKMKLSIYVCESCGKTSVPKRLICPACKSTNFTTKELEGEGKVYSFTKINVSSVEFKHLTPYYVVLVDLPTGERITGRTLDDIQIDDTLQLVDVDNGAYIWAKG
ncbi:OB-fold domain-containing protein, partial [Heyndrickxia sporothermodurans]